MIIKEERGDIFRSDCQTWACPINVVGTMGNGLARAFRDRIPGLNEFYQSKYPPHASGFEHRAHELCLFPMSDGRQVLLFPTKVHWRDPSPVELVQANLSQIEERYGELGIDSLAVPALGCGKGGLRYEQDVRPLFYRFLSPLPITVEVLFW